MSVPLVIVELIANRNAPRLLAHHCFVQHRWRSKEDVVLFVQIPFNKVRTTIANFCLSFLFVFCVFIFAIRIQVCNDISGLFNIQYVMCSLGGPYSEKLRLRSWKSTQTDSKPGWLFPLASRVHVTMTVVREGEIRTALSIHQTAGYVTMPSFYGLSSNSELLLASPSFKIKKNHLVTGLSLLLLMEQTAEGNMEDDN